MKLFRCPRCFHGLPVDLIGTGGGDGHCGACTSPVALRIFTKAVEQGQSPPPVPEAAATGDASCFYSPERKATAICGECGVFISELHTAKWGETSVCLKCLAKQRARAASKGESGGRFESGRVLWDNVILAVALFPILLPFLWFFSFISAPAALVLGLIHWRKPRSVIPRNRWRLVLGMLLALVQIVGWVVMFIGLVSVGEGS